MMPIFSNEQKRIVNLIRDGVRLCKSVQGNEPEYYFSDGREPCPKPATVMALRNAGIIAPAGDSMFGATQTYDLVFMPREAL